MEHQEFDNAPTTSEQSTLDSDQYKQALPALPAYRQRVVDERTGLANRLNDLKTFIKENPLFGGLPADEQVRIKIQAYFMGGYLEILEARIDAF